MFVTKILFLDHTPFPGGAQICLATDIRYLDRKKFDPILAIDKSSKFANIYKDSNVKIYKIDFGKLKSPNPLISLKNLYTSYTQFKALIKTTNPNLVFANTTRALVLSSLAKSDYKLVSFLRDYDYPKALLKILSPRVDKFLAVSNSVKNYYQINATVVYLGSDIHTKKISSQNIQTFQKKLNIQKEDTVIGFVGRLVDWKGADILLEAFSKLNLSQTKLLFFGTGQSQSGNIEDDLKLEIRNLKLKDRVTIAGFIEDAALVFNLVNIFVLPSKKPEPFSTSVIEAALSKIPIIATNTGGTSEFIVQGKTGLLVDPQDPQKLAKSLVRLIQDQKLDSRLTQNAYTKAQEFREEIFIKKLEEIFDGLTKP